MEYFRSQSLRQFINNRPENLEFSPKRKENYEICLQICQAVSYLHELTCSIIHKDIKLEKILVNEHLMVKLCDLGLSKISDIDSSSPLNTIIGHNFRGTPMFMALEIIVQNLPAMKPTDVWAMACCLVELFCEREVWIIEPKFTTHALRELLLKRLKPDLTNIPSVLQGIISACFNQEPTERPTALILVKMFERLLHGAYSSLILFLELKNLISKAQLIPSLTGHKLAVF
ncbi:hypothetical protein KQX54_012167 [Cotesia glomerata]|uniref:Protein kinase domain-containing protein n=1 Tax=Cotesia glomerata TaxID=32391 RepID=A0AAV7I276_COTGL|nr:hypothetical protein KQX54_012167 [Cotesia glomerata]